MQDQSHRLIASAARILHCVALLYLEHADDNRPQKKKYRSNCHGICKTRDLAASIPNTRKLLLRRSTPVNTCESPAVDLRA